MQKYEVKKNGKTLTYMMTEKEIRDITKDNNLNVEKYAKNNLLYCSGEDSWYFSKIETGSEPKYKETIDYTPAFQKSFTKEWNAARFKLNKALLVETP